MSLSLVVIQGVICLLFIIQNHSVNRWIYSNLKKSWILWHKLPYCDFSIKTYYAFHGYKAYKLASQINIHLFLIGRKRKEMLLTAGLPIKHMQQQGMNVGLPGRWKDPNCSLAAIVKRYRQEAEPGTKARHSKVGCKCLNQQVNIHFLVATFSLFLSIFACSLSQCYRNRDKDRDTLWGFPTSHGTDSWGWPGRSQQLSPSFYELAAVQALGPSSTALHRPLGGSCIANGPTGTPTNAHTGYWHHRW